MNALPILLGAGGLVDVEPGLIIWTLVTFGLLLAILRWKAWGPILSTIEAREKRIRDALDAAEQGQAEVEKMMADNQAALEAARKESAEVVRQTKAEVGKAREEQLAKAREEADKLIASARSQIEEEKKQALAEVRKVAVDLAIGAAGHLLKSQMDEARQRELVEAYLKELPSAEA
ncbi:MAG: F0F1 ATP synthase subunit B [Deltaproteobacteria bacterium]|nr:F0F1 ATP synthase subunit B [Deltaproteobacteria bacterium]